jgi:hypothetical protein
MTRAAARGCARRTPLNVASSRPLARHNPSAQHLLAQAAGSHLPTAHCSVRPLPAGAGCALPRSAWSPGSSSRRGTSLARDMAMRALLLLTAAAGAAAQVRAPANVTVVPGESGGVGSGTRGEGSTARHRTGRLPAPSHDIPRLNPPRPPLPPVAQISCSDDNSITVNWQHGGDGLARTYTGA